LKEYQKNDHYIKRENFELDVMVLGNLAAAKWIDGFDGLELN
jgi:hypothetical protein